MDFHDLSEQQKNELTAYSIRQSIGLISEDITAIVLDVQPSTLQTWRSQGTGPDYLKLGKGVFYTSQALAAHVNLEVAKQRSAREAKGTA